MIPPGRDRRARLVTATTTGLVPHLARPRQRGVLVVGGGLAGVAAAVVLAERGVGVTLCEAGSVLGGRVASWTDRLNGAAGGSSFEMERGFHAFFRQYYNVRALLRRIDPALHSLRPLPDYPLFGPGGSRASFAGLPRTPPLNLAALVRRTPELDVRALRAIDGAVAAEMLAFDGDDTYRRFDEMSAAEYLDRVRFPADARRMLFEVFAHSFFNPEGEMSAGEMLMMFHLYFLGTAEGILFDVLDEPFGDALWRPMARLLDRLRVEVRLDERVDEIAPERYDGVVLAVDVAGVRSVVAANPWIGAGDDSWNAAIDGLASAPPFAVWRLWLDRPVAAERAAFAGTAGLGIVDNISVVDRYQGEARRWALRNGGSVVELHAYALPRELHGDRAGVTAELWARLASLYPEVAAARVLDERYLERADCAGFPPGSWASRPGTATPTPSVALAGDYVRLPFPTALMERAVASGIVAANHLLRPWGVAPEPVWSIPPHGVLAGLQRWQRRRKARAGSARS